MKLHISDSRLNGFYYVMDEKDVIVYMCRTYNEAIIYIDMNK